MSDEMDPQRPSRFSTADGLALAAMVTLAAFVTMVIVSDGGSGLAFPEVMRSHRAVIVYGFPVAACALQALAFVFRSRRR